MKLPRSVRLLVFGFLLSMIPALLSSPSAAQIGIGISVRIGPPALPVYEQPICPGEGYLWTPGYWAWSDDDGYYWVPGTWVVAPVGMLWTPGYWGWGDGFYAWHAGYWGPHIGFYGGINYGFGYGGEGFYGGEWRGGAFFYNTAVMRVDTVHITNVYVNRTVIVNNESHVAFNGGAGGVAARPTAREEEFSREEHRPALATQTEHQHAASQNRALFASENHGRPAVAATAKPGEFSGRGVVAARSAGAAYHAPAMSPKEARASAPAGNRAAENRPAENRPAENRAPATNGTKAANRPFVPPNKSNTNQTEKTNRPESTNRPENNSRASSARPNESHAAKPFTPPPSSHASNSPRTESPARESAPRAEKAPRAESSHSAAEPRAQSAPKPAPQARESAPRQSAPKPSAGAPKPQKESPPPKHENPPKGEHKGR